MADEAKAGGAAGASGTSGPESEGPEGPDTRSRTWMWMLLALVVVGGFLTWLGAASEPSSVAVVETEDEDQVTETLEDGVVAVPRDTLAEDKGRWEGQEIQVAGVEATGRLGPGIFWGELGDAANQVPILVRLDSIAAEGFEMQQSARYTITGAIFPMSDSVAAGWEEAGEFDGEGEAMQAAFTDYYIQASRVRQSRQDSGE